MKKIIISVMASVVAIGAAIAGIAALKKRA